MSISMIGIDHSMAPIDIRALFAFTRKNAGEAMEKIKEQPGINGCIILSTCNRLEVWASVDEETEISLYEELCRLKKIQNREYEKYFIKREGHDAVEHLFYLASGLKSQILGEDQILTQVKDALGIAREHFTTDGAFSNGRDSRQEDQNRSPIFPWKSICDPSGYTNAGKTRLFSKRKGLYGDRKR